MSCGIGGALLWLIVAVCLAILPLPQLCHLYYYYMKISEETGEMVWLLWNSIACLTRPTSGMSKFRQRRRTMRTDRVNYICCCYNWTRCPQYEGSEMSQMFGLDGWFWGTITLPPSVVGVWWKGNGTIIVPQTVSQMDKVKIWDEPLFRAEIKRVRGIIKTFIKVGQMKWK